jgi:hypothetical protein
MGSRFLPFPPKWKVSMHRSLLRLALASGVAVLTASMTACSNDLPDEPSAGAPQADVGILAVPANDDFEAAEVIPELPFTDSDITTDATTAPDDPADCFGNETTVWYQFTPSVDTRINANTLGSDYDTGLAIYTGTRGDLTEIGCNDDFIFTGGPSSVTFDASAGVTYFFKVGSFAGTPGGNLVFNVNVALEVELTIDPVGSVNGATGVATIRGTVTCSRDASGDIGVELRQRVGRAIISGFSGITVQCDGVTQWEAVVDPQNGLFVGGRAEVSAFVSVFDPVTSEEASDSETATVRLSGKGK